MFWMRNKKVNFLVFTLIYRPVMSSAFSKKSFSSIIRVSSGLDPDQDRQNIGPDVGPNYLHTTFRH